MSRWRFPDRIRSGAERGCASAARRVPRSWPAAPKSLGSWSQRSRV